MHLSSGLPSPQRPSPCFRRVGRLAGEGRRFFLFGPRRFGKSLLLDAPGKLFEGREELFRGLHIHGHWNWSVRHPVVRLSFDGKYNDPKDLERSILSQLAIVEHAAGLDPALEFSAGPERLQSILYRLHHATGQRVVVLVDEYDKPILAVLRDPDLASANRDPSLFRS